MVRAIKSCPQCSTEQAHAFHPARAQWVCNGCGLASWPADRGVDDPDLAAGTAPIAVEDRAAQEAGAARLLGMWRAAVATVTEAARREAEERTGRLDEGKAPSPVVDDPLATVPGKRGLA